MAVETVNREQDQIKIKSLTFNLFFLFNLPRNRRN